MIGRVAFPLFFLLIGRNESRRLSWSLIRSAVIIQSVFWITSYLYKYDLRQINILPAAIIVKYLLSHWVPFLKSNIIRYTMPNISSISIDKIIKMTIVVACIIGIPWTHSRIEYGSMTLWVALLGSSIKHYKHDQWYITCMSILVIYGLYSINHQFWFSPLQWTIIVRWWISWIIAVVALSYSNTSLKSWSTYRNNTILRVSRYAVQIYVIHVLILLGIVVAKRAMGG